jgi:hypothetical protein
MPVFVVPAPDPGRESAIPAIAAAPCPGAQPVKVERSERLEEPCLDGRAPGRTCPLSACSLRPGCAPSGRGPRHRARAGTTRRRAWSEERAPQLLARQGAEAVPAPSAAAAEGRRDAWRDVRPHRRCECERRVQALVDRAKRAPYARAGLT